MKQILFVKLLNKNFLTLNNFAKERKERLGKRVYLGERQRPVLLSHPYLWVPWIASLALHS
jgi:hypothetical protein